MQLLKKKIDNGVESGEIFYKILLENLDTFKNYFHLCIPNLKNVLRIELHIESWNGFSLRTSYANSGACYIQK